MPERPLRRAGVAFRAALLRHRHRSLIVELNDRMIPTTLVCSVMMLCSGAL